MVIMPIICSPCIWKIFDWLEKMQVFPKDGYPLSKMDNETQDVFFVELAGVISQLFNI